MDAVETLKEKNELKRKESGMPFLEQILKVAFHKAADINQLPLILTHISKINQIGGALLEKQWLIQKWRFSMHSYT